MFDMEQLATKHIKPDRTASLAYFCSLVDEEMVEAIAHADYGRDKDLHFSALLPIWQGSEFTQICSRHPLEVLKLTRWHEIDTRKASTDPRESAYNRMRAFSCAILLAAENIAPLADTLIYLLESAYILGPKALTATTQLLNWKIPQISSAEDRPYFVLAITLLLCELEKDMSVLREEQLANWLTEEELNGRENAISIDPDDNETTWLIGLSTTSSHQDKWKKILTEFINKHPDRPISLTLQEHLPLT